eukprot:COSAG02_NODE_515_length_20817_cov_61.106960_4_plen_215_part_00
MLKKSSICKAFMKPNEIVIVALSFGHVVSGLFRQQLFSRRAVCGMRGIRMAHACTQLRIRTARRAREERSDLGASARARARVRDASARACARADAYGCHATCAMGRDPQVLPAQHHRAGSRRAGPGSRGRRGSVRTATRRCVRPAGATRRRDPQVRPAGATRRRDPQARPAGATRRCDPQVRPAGATRAHEVPTLSGTLHVRVKARCHWICASH